MLLVIFYLFLSYLFFKKGCYRRNWWWCGQWSRFQQHQSRASEFRFPLKFWFSSQLVHYCCSKVWTLKLLPSRNLFSSFIFIIFITLYLVPFDSQQAIFQPYQYVLRLYFSWIWGSKIKIMPLNAIILYMYMYFSLYIHCIYTLYEITLI